MAINIIVTDTSPRFRAQVADHVGEDGHIVEAEGPEDARQAIAARNGSPVLMIIGPSSTQTDALDLAMETQQAAPEVPVILVAGKLTASLLQKALRAGIRDVLPTSCSRAEFRQAVERAGSLAGQLIGDRTEVHNGSSGKGKVITIFSAKGGCGKSVLASNLAVLLAEEHDSSVALVDLDLESGDASIMLQLNPSRTIYEVSERINSIDEEALKGYMSRYRDGLYLLAAPKEPGLGDKVTPEAVRRILGLLRDTFDYVVVDGPSFFTEQVLAALDDSDECILVASLDVPSVKNVKVAMRTLELIGFKKERLKLVLNRADSRVGLDVGEVEKALGTRITMQIPSSRDVPLCVNRGVPVVVASSSSKVSHALREIASRVTGEELEGQTGKGRSWRRRRAG